MHGTKIKKKHS